MSDVVQYGSLPAITYELPYYGNASCLVQEKPIGYIIGKCLKDSFDYFFPRGRLLVQRDVYNKEDIQDLRNFLNIHKVEYENFKQIQELKLNKLMQTTVPRALSLLRELRKIDLSGNDLKVFPPEILGLTQLEELNLSGNSITDIPKKISDLKNLRVLNLKANHLVFLPQEVEDLIQLEVLDLSENKFDYIPSFCMHLPEMRILNFSGRFNKKSSRKGVSFLADYNRVKTLSRTILNHPPHLEKINFVFSDQADTHAIEKIFYDPKCSLVLKGAIIRALDLADNFFVRSLARRLLEENPEIFNEETQLKYIYYYIKRKIHSQHHALNFKNIRLMNVTSENVLERSIQNKLIAVKKDALEKFIEISRPQLFDKFEEELKGKYKGSKKALLEVLSDLYACILSDSFGFPVSRRPQISVDFAFGGLYMVINSYLRHFTQTLIQTELKNFLLEKFSKKEVYNYVSDMGKKRLSKIKTKGPYEKHLDLIINYILEVKLGLIKRKSSIV